jgi:HEAT repeat protein
MAEQNKGSKDFENIIVALLERYVHDKYEAGTNAKEAQNQILSKGKPAVAVLITRLSGAESPRERQAAAELLGECGDFTAINSLASSFSSESDRKVKSAALSALSRLLSQTLGVFNSPSITNSQKAAIKAELARLLQTDIGLTVIIDKFDKSTDVNIRRASIKVMEDISNQKVSDILKGALTDPDWVVRASAAETMGKSGDKRHGDDLVAALKDDNKHVRQDVVNALASLGDCRAYEPLVQYLNSTDPADRRLAVAGLKKLKDDRVIAHLINSLKDSDRLVRKNAAMALPVLRASEAILALSNSLQVEADAAVKETMTQSLDSLKKFHLSPGLRVIPGASDKLHLSEWEKLNFVVINESKGIASGISIAARGPVDFITETVGSLRPGESQQVNMSIRPKETGRSVPIEIHLTFKDDFGNQSNHQSQACLWVVDPEKERIQSPSMIVQGSYYAGGHKEITANEVLESGAIKATDSVVSKKEETKGESNTFNVCPYCGEELKLLIPPKFCPYCKARLVK